VPAACLTLDLTLPSGKRRKHDAAALGHRTALEPLNTSTLGAGDPQTQRTYLARSERVQLHIGTLSPQSADSAAEPLKLLPACHGWLDSILADETVTAHTDRKAKAKSKLQRRYKVQWRPSLLVPWALAAHTAMGFEVKATVPVTMADLVQARADYTESSVDEPGQHQTQPQALTQAQASA
jgi:hypothetical protein